MPCVLTFAVAAAHNQKLPRDQFRSNSSLRWARTTPDVLANAAAGACSGTCRTAIELRVMYACCPQQFARAIQQTCSSLRHAMGAPPPRHPYPEAWSDGAPQSSGIPAPAQGGSAPTHAQQDVSNMFVEDARRLAAADPPRVLVVPVVDAGFASASQ